MPLVQYKGNADSYDGTSVLGLAQGRRLVLDGPPVELTDAEYASLRGRYILDVWEPKVTETAAPVVPAPPAPPAPPQPPVAPVTPQTVTSPSTPTASSQSVAPPSPPPAEGS